MRLQRGQLVQHLRIVGVLGEGATAIVYLVEDTANGDEKREPMGSEGRNQQESGLGANGNQGREPRQSGEPHFGNQDEWNS